MIIWTAIGSCSLVVTAVTAVVSAGWVRNRSRVWFRHDLPILAAAAITIMCKNGLQDDPEWQAALQKLEAFK